MFYSLETLSSVKDACFIISSFYTLFRQKSIHPRIGFGRQICAVAFLTEMEFQRQELSKFHSLGFNDMFKQPAGGV